MHVSGRELERKAMGQYVRLRSVNAWYDEVGAGEPLVLLHGAHVDARFFDENIRPLAGGSTSTYPSDAATATQPTPMAHTATT